MHGNGLFKSDPNRPIPAEPQHVVAAVASGTVSLAHDDVQAFDTFVRSNNYPVVHHTPAFIKEYQPAYRVLSRCLFQAPRAGEVPRAHP